MPVLVTALPSFAKWLQLLIGNKIENNRHASNYKHYMFILIRKQCGRRKITVITSVAVVTVIKKGIGRIIVGSCRCTYPSIPLFRLKITVGCPRCCGVWCVVWYVGVGVWWWCVCVVCVVCCVGVGVWSWWCCVLCGVVCVFCVFVLFCFFSLDSLLSLSCSLLSFFSLFFFLLSSFPLLSSLSCLLFLFLFSLLFSPPNTVERTDQPTRRPTSRHLNVILRTAGAQQSVLTLLLLLKKRRKNF